MRLTSTADGKENQKEDESQGTIEPPDGGWGWVVMIASFLCNLVVDGIAYSFGVFLIEFVQYYGSATGKTAWIGSLLTGCYLSTGPIASALTNRFGCRTVVITGSTIASIGFILSTFAPNVDVLMLTYGIMGGIGFGLIYLPSIVSVSYYFSRKRALATGIAVCGSGTGSFVFPPICQLLLTVYDWRGVTTILAGLILNCMVFGALMRPVESHSNRKKKNKKKETKINPKEDWTLLKERTIDTEPDTVHSEMSLHQVNKTTDQMTTESSVGDGVKLLWESKNGTVNVSCKDNFYGGSLASVTEHNQFQSDKQMHKASLSVQVKKDPGKSSRIPPSAKKTLKEAFNFSLLENPAFLLLCVSNIFGMMGYYIPYVYIIDSSVVKGIPKEDAVFILSMIGVTNTIARIVFGWIADRSGVNSLWLNNACLLLSGLSVLCVPFLSTYTTVAIASTLFGLFISAYICLTSIILVDLVGLDHLPNAFGLLNVFRGVASLVGSPVAGSIFDMTGSYEYPFYAAGGMLMAAAFCSALVPPAKLLFTWRKNKHLQVQRYSEALPEKSEELQPISHRVTEV